MTRALYCSVRSRREAEEKQKRRFGVKSRREAEEKQKRSRREAEEKQKRRFGVKQSSHVCCNQASVVSLPSPLCAICPHASPRHLGTGVAALPLLLPQAEDVLLFVPQAVAQPAAAGGEGADAGAVDKLAAATDQHVDEDSDIAAHRTTSGSGCIRWRLGRWQLAVGSEQLKDIQEKDIQDAVDGGGEPSSSFRRTSRRSEQPS